MGKTIVKILGVVVLLLIIANLIGLFTSDQVYIKTFSAFLEYLSDFPSISLGWEIPSLSVDWTGILEPIADFINLNIKILNFLIFIVEGLVNLCVGVLYIFRWIV
ncbi:MAG: hypothetical protein IJX30_03465 [Clostridia bacterium]|nr:hypothetical protein [Clostridia bacterium]